MFRVDFLFSYWILAWYLLYITRFISYSPKFALILTVMESVFSFIIIKTANTQTILGLILIAFLFKIGPLYSIRKTPIVLKDIFFTGGLFVLYCIWMNLNKEPILPYYQKLQVSFDKNDHQTPGLALIDFLQKATRL
jgi:hypothetical protein